MNEVMMNRNRVIANAPWCQDVIPPAGNIFLSSLLTSNIPLFVEGGQFGIFNIIYNTYRGFATESLGYFVRLVAERMLRDLQGHEIEPYLRTALEGGNVARDFPIRGYDPREEVPASAAWATVHLLSTRTCGGNMAGKTAARAAEFFGMTREDINSLLMEAIMSEHGSALRVVAQGATPWNTYGLDKPHLDALRVHHLSVPEGRGHEKGETRLSRLKRNYEDRVNRATADRAGKHGPEEYWDDAVKLYDNVVERVVRKLGRYPRGIHTYAASLCKHRTSPWTSKSAYPYDTPPRLFDVIRLVRIRG